MKMLSNRRFSSVSGSGVDKFKSDLNTSGSVKVCAEWEFGSHYVHVVRYFPQEALWFVGLSSGVIHVLSTGLERSINEFSCGMSSENLPCTDIQFLQLKNEESENIILATYASGFVRMWRLPAVKAERRLISEWREVCWQPENSESIRSIGDVNCSDSACSFNQILACSCSMDGRRFVTGGVDSVIRVYDALTRSLTNLCQSSYLHERMDGHVRRITALKYHPRGATSHLYAHIFISASWDDSIQIWDDRHQQSLWQYYGPHVCGNDAIDIEPEANQIITASWSRENSILQVWDFNEDAVRKFAETGNREMIRGSLVISQSKNCNAEKHLTPFADIIQNQFEQPTSGYVAFWLGTKHMIYGGSHEHIVKIIDKSTLNTIATLSKFPRGVISMAVSTPLALDTKEVVKVAIASGCKLYLAAVEYVFI